MKLPLNLYTANQVRELDRIAINDFDIAGFTLMKRAGRATFQQIQAAYPKAKTICVVCGTGNNGGDGYVIATDALKAGLSVNLIQVGNTHQICGDAQLARQAYLQLNGIESHYDTRLLDVDIIVDALFGTGLSRDITGLWAQVIEAINQSRAKVIAVDIPSGLDTDTGVILGVAIRADMTVTYIGLKAGLFTGKAREMTGHIKFHDLHIPKKVYSLLDKTTQVDKQLISEIFIQQVIKPRLRISHKGHHGHVLLVGGAEGMSGAIRLAAEASLRAGAGLVTVATASSHANMINLTRPELMVTGVEHAEALQVLIDKVDVIVIGPGLGQSDWAKALFNEVCESDKPKVLDADALNLLSKTSLSDVCWILTPHPAEAGRLLGVTTDVIEQNRYHSIQKIVKNRGGGCILKGAGSLVSDGHTIRVCRAGNPGMASGGMGDVLSGIVGALLAQGLSLFDAATAATQIHAQAGDLAAKQGERGLLASDLFPYIRELVNPVELL